MLTILLREQNGDPNATLDTPYAIVVVILVPNRVAKGPAWTRARGVTRRPAQGGVRVRERVHRHQAGYGGRDGAVRAECDRAPPPYTIRSASSSSATWRPRCSSAPLALRRPRSAARAWRLRPQRSARRRAHWRSALAIEEIEESDGEVEIVKSVVAKGDAVKRSHSGATKSDVKESPLAEIKDDFHVCLVRDEDEARSTADRPGHRRQLRHECRGTLPSRR